MLLIIGFIALVVLALVVLAIACWDGRSSAGGIQIRTRQAQFIAEQRIAAETNATIAAMRAAARHELRREQDR